mgnify:CR=1 FL=1
MPRTTTHHFWRSSALPFVESRRASDSAACYAPHSHSTLSIGAVDSGESVFSRNGQRQKLVRGDVVRILDPKGSELARGICRYDHLELDRLRGVHSDNIEQVLGYGYGAVAIHRDDMVLL